MEGLLEQLRELLKTNRATIVRSADENHKLVLSMLDDNGNCHDEEFEEEIGASSIANGWHKTIK